MKTNIYPVEKLGSLDLQQLYSRANEWLDDIDFCETEVRFFKKVSDLYILKSDKVTRNRIEQIQKELFQLQLDKHVIRADVINHREVIELLIRNLITQDEQQLKQRQEDLESRISQLNNAFRDFKNSLFKLTEEIINED